MSFRSISENLNAYREEAGSHPVALDRVLGFTFIRAWVYLMFVGAAASSMTWSGEQIPPLFYVVSTASLCAVLFGSALAGERFVRFMTHPAARFAAPALTTGGTLLLASSAAGTGAALSFGILGAITTGIGSGLIDLGYGELYRNEPAPPAPRSRCPWPSFWPPWRFPSSSCCRQLSAASSARFFPPFPAGSCSSSSMPGRANTRPASCPSIST